MISIGKLYIVATPIGNLEDITLRAITVLKQVKIIAAEDTRQSRKLLQHYGINAVLCSLHAHNEKAKSQTIINYLTQGDDVAYITDAGTPLISDPGAILVKSVRDAGFIVHPIPGPCAAIAALSISGWSSPNFYFEGFLPHKSSSRKNRLMALKYFDCTLIFYESPHRILSMLENVFEILGDREVILARELTKKYETVIAGKIRTVLGQVKQSSEQRLGEFVVLVAGALSKEEVDQEKKMATLALLLEELPVKRAITVASTLLNTNKNELYAMALKIKEKLL